ncbi:telomeric repeat binding factor a isoform X2 [Synchiropus splendidus]|uniref:telomeric repeat binding factor a isoform X2 n=1 Tax=Synchiropus splendidus TaxID=270530 RepID=UPI00237E3B7F|nr:telomeric repeat binding factor a isoform X2 [Synchiropus splendidus]
MASDRTQVEKVVTRWIVDYYCFLAFDSFKRGRFSEFSTVKDFLTSSVTPLETALMLLDNICQTSELSPQDLQDVRTSIQKTIVRLYMKNMELDRAQEMVHTYFSNGSDKSHFLSLISSRTEGQHVDENIDFEDFHCQMLAFCEKVWTFSPPFLYKAATELNRRLGEVRLSAPSVANYKHGIIQRSRLEKAYSSLAAGTNHITFAQLEEEVESEQSLSLRLSPSEELAAEEEQVHQCSQPPSLPENPQTPSHVLPKTETRTPPPFDSPLRRPGTSVCQTTESEHESSAVVSPLLDKRKSATSAEDDVAASRKRPRKTNGRSRSPPEREEAACCTSSDSPVQHTEKETDGVSQHSDSAEDSFTDSFPVSRQHSTPLKDPESQSSPSTSKWQQLMKNAKESKETWPEEESVFRQDSRSDNSFTAGFKKRWTAEETAWLREGVKKFGEGKWSKILSYYGFKNRTNVNLKDRWRTMKKLNMV